MKYIGTCTLEIDSSRIPQCLNLGGKKSHFVDLEDVLFYSNDEASYGKKPDTDINPDFESFIAQKSLKFTELVNFGQIPFWFFDKSSTDLTEYQCFTEKELTEEFFRQLVKVSLSSKTVLTLLFEAKHPSKLFRSTNHADYSLAIYPKVIQTKDPQTGYLSEKVLICANLLNFKTPIALKLSRVRAHAESGKLAIPSDQSTKSVFVEVDAVSKKRDKFFDNYLKKRSVSRQQSVSREDSLEPVNSPVSLSDRADIHEQFFDLLDRCILGEFRMRSASENLSKSELDELYTLISRSAKFIFRVELKKRKVPSLDSIGDVVTSMADILLQGERRKVNKVSDSFSLKHQSG